jgi:hypothetical protein
MSENRRERQTTREIAAALDISYSHALRLWRLAKEAERAVGGRTGEPPVALVRALLDKERWWNGEAS